MDVGVPWGTHFRHDLPVDQLEPLVGTEHPRLGGAVHLLRVHSRRANASMPLFYGIRVAA